MVSLTTITLPDCLTGYRISGFTVPLTNSIRRRSEGRVATPQMPRRVSSLLPNVFAPAVRVMSPKTLSLFGTGISWQVAKRRLDCASPATDAMSGNCVVRGTPVHVPAVSAMGSNACTVRRERLGGRARPTRWHPKS